MNTLTSGLRKSSTLLNRTKFSPYNLRSLSSEKRNSSSSITQDKKNEKFVMPLNGETAFVEYEMENAKTYRFIETFVPDSHRGKGIAGQLASHVFDHVLEKNMKMILACTYLQSYYAKNPEKYKHIVLEDSSEKSTASK